MNATIYQVSQAIHSIFSKKCNCNHKESPVHEPGSCQGLSSSYNCRAFMKRLVCGHLFFKFLRSLVFPAFFLHDASTWFANAFTLFFFICNIRQNNHVFFNCSKNVIASFTVENVLQFVCSQRFLSSVSSSPGRPSERRL